MRLIIHIGYNQTGTQSIQSYCVNNSEALQRDGLCYPKAGIHNNAHRAVSKLFVGAPSSAVVDAPKDLLPRINQEFAESGCGDLLLSSEHLVLASPGHIKAMHDAFQNDFGMEECRIIVYLRRHDLWFESLFNQAVQNVDSPPWELDIKDYIIQLLGGGGNMPHYLTVLDRWATEFGQESIVVRPFENGQFKRGNLVCDFFDSVFPRHEVKAEAVDITENLSVSPEKLYLIGLLRRWPKSPQRDAAIGELQKAPDGSGTVIPENFGVLTEKQRSSIIQFFKPEYAIIARRFLSRSGGRLFFDGE
jgi:hypothetical protein